MDGSHSTFAFADIAGFTALTEAHGDEHAADLVDAFGRGVRDVLPAEGADLVKTIGDAVMLRFADAATAVSTSVVVAEQVMARHGFPAVRVGLHRGPAVVRDGDWLGATVNLAARVTELAAGNEVLLTAAVRDAAGALDGIELVAHGEHRLRNVAAPVRLWRAARAGAARSDVAVDPVCRMAVDPRQAAGTLVHEGRRYVFCSLECAARFATAPGEYATA